MFSVLISAVVLLVAGILLVRVLYKDPITRQKLAIEEAGNAQIKAGLIKKSQTGNNFAISRLETAGTAIKAAFGGRQPEPDYDRHRKAETIRHLVLVGVLLDWLIQWMVNQRMLILSPLGWIIPSLILALLITWFVELAAFVLTDDPARQSRGERLCRDAVIATGIVSVSCLLIFLYGRTVSASSVNDWLIAIISGSLWIVAEGLGVACGFAAAWARHVDKAGDGSRKFHEIEEQLQARYEFRDWLSDQETKSKIKLTTAVILLFMILIPNASGFAQGVSGPDLTILIDGTASVDQVSMSDALARLRESVPDLARRYTRVRVGIFSDEGPFTKIGWAVSIPPLAPVKDCSALASSKTFRQDLTILLPGIKEYQETRNNQECLATNAKVEQKNRENLKTAIAKIQASIPQSIEPKAGCTAIAALLHFILSSPPSSKSAFMLITDAEETCSEDTIAGSRIPAGLKVILFLVPRVGPIEKEGPEALRRGEKWQATFPGLIARPYTQIPEAIESLFMAPFQILSRGK